MHKQCPNLFLIGAPKAGTTALAHSLSLHPDIYCKEKEPRFFDAAVFFDDPELHPFKSFEEYSKLYESFEAKSAKYCLDASVFTMYSLDSIAEILRIRPDARFLLILRDPITSTKSMFLQRLKYVREDMREVSDDFRECLGLLKDRENGDGLPRGCKTSIVFRYDILYHYERYVYRIKEIVDSDRMFILRYEDYKHHPSEFFSEILSWLGLGKTNQIDSSRLLNSGPAVSRSFSNKIIDALGYRTIRFRRRLGLTGKKISGVKKLLELLVIKKKVVIGNDCDPFLKEEFYETYKFLEEAEKNGLIRRVSPEVRCK